MTHIPPLKHFSLTEFQCPCCGLMLMDPYFLKKLDLARDYAGVPFVITSGFRCKRHNEAVGGKPDSAHLKGKAADIACTSSHRRWLIVRSLIQAKFSRIGIGHDFIHVDDDPDKVKGVIWLY